MATGLGIYSFVWFVIAILHALWTIGTGYHRLDQAGQVADLVVLAYWLHSFWIEADRETAARHASSGLAVIPGRKNTERALLGTARIGHSPIHYEEPG